MSQYKDFWDLKFKPHDVFNKWRQAVMRLAGDYGISVVATERDYNCAVMKFDGEEYEMVDAQVTFHYKTEDEVSELMEKIQTTRVSSR